MPDPLSIATWRNVFTKYGQQLGWGLVLLIGAPLVIGFGMSQYSGRGQQGAPGQSPSDVIATVNGDPITAEQFGSASSQANSEAPGRQFAAAQGKAMGELVADKVLEQIARDQGVHVSDADIDKKIAETRPKGMSDADFESQLEQRGMSLSDLRDDLARDPQLLETALTDQFKSAEKVTADDARKQSEEVRLDLVLVPAINTMMSMGTPPGGPTPLPDAMAKQRADQLQAQARAGIDMTALAKVNSGDPSAKKGGILDWQPEFPQQDKPGLMYGKDFDQAVQNTPKGQVTPVVKTTGLHTGYVFAKVLDRRNNVPKNLDVKKTIDDLKTQRATEKLGKLFEAKLKAARVNFTDNNQDKQAYYDLYKAEAMEQQQMYAQFGQGDLATAPTAADVARQQALADKEIAALQKKHPDDATPALIVAEELKPKLTSGMGPNGRPLTPDQKKQLQDQLIALYEAALKSTEDKNIRFDLADMYRERKQFAQADKEYAMVVRLLDVDEPYDLNTMQTALSDRQKLVTGFNAIGKPEAAAKQQAIVAKLNKQIAVEQKKEAAKNAANSKNGPAPMPGGPIPASGGPVPASGPTPPAPTRATAQPGGKPGAAPPVAGAPKPAGVPPKPTASHPSGSGP